MLEGLVINSQKNKFRVKTEKEIFLCDVKGNLFEKNKDTKNFLVTGDYVLFEKVEDQKGLIFEIKPRKSTFYRKGVGSDKHKKQIVATNIDQAVIVFSVKNPSYKVNLIDRYLILLKKQNILPIICFNKLDLCKYEEIKKDVENYQQKGVTIVLTSSYTNSGLDELRSLLKDKISVFSGTSGVGKSSLINRVLGEKIAKVSEVSTFLDKGKHTTTTSNIYELDFGGMIIDTPGMKEVGFVLEQKDLDASFEDILELSKTCKFRDCQHLDEPDCAVRKALALEEISEKNFKSYMKLKQGTESRKQQAVISNLRRESVKTKQKNQKHEKGEKVYD